MRKETMARRLVNNREERVPAHLSQRKPQVGVFLSSPLTAGMKEGVIQWCTLRFPPS